MYMPTLPSTFNSLVEKTVKIETEKPQYVIESVKFQIYNLFTNIFIKFRIIRKYLIAVQIAR